jgi:murein DD-endopeptidase MepM/ murein hydrolase activator NlpD
LYDVPWAPGPYDHFFFRRPIAADEVNWPVADYRYGGIFPDTEIIHTGIDIDAPMHTPVLAAAPGRVVWTGYGLFRGVYDTQDPYGLAVALRHDFGYQGKQLFTVYAHLDQVVVVIGQELKSGDPLGLVGNTGKTTGPHLHFEVRVQGNDFYRSRNPELWLAPPQGWGLLVGRLTKPDGTYLYNKEILVMTRDKLNSWLVRTYGPQAVNNDTYYQENMVLSDLPAGDYTIWIQYDAVRYNLDVRIVPGQVTYFSFNGKNLFHTDPPKLEDPLPFLTPRP